MKRLGIVVGLVLLGTACGPGSGASDVSPGPGGDTRVPAGVEAARFSITTLTGFVFDAASGRPVANATVGTDPATEVARTNQTGFFALSVGHAFGVVTLNASAPGYTQRQRVCVNLKPGLNSLADVSLVRVESTGDAECVPECTGATVCVNGTCVSRCNPLCACNQVCGDDGVCFDDPNAVPAAICGINSHPLGVGVCECDLGFVAAGDGRSCVRPADVGTCPAFSVRTETGCECQAGYLPDPRSDACLPADELAAPTAFGGDGIIVAEFRTPGPAPRGIAFDGRSLWIADAGTDLLYRVARRGGEIEASFPLGGLGREIRDMTHDGTHLFLSVRVAPTTGQPAIFRVDPTTGTLTKLDQTFGMNTADGITFDGEYLASLEDEPGQQMVKRRFADLGSSAYPTTVQVSAAPTGDAFFAGYKPVQYLAYTQNQFIAWTGTRFGGDEFVVEFVTLNAVHKTTSTELGRLVFPLGGSHVVGLEAYGATLWVALAGSGFDTPKVVEVVLD